MTGSAPIGSPLKAIIIKERITQGIHIKSGHPVFQVPILVLDNSRENRDT